MLGCVVLSGAGKSTLSLALLRYVEPWSGTVSIDGLDICAMGLEDLRRRITIIPQDPVLFKGTIRSNLDPFEEHDDTTLWEALRRVRLVGQATAPTAVPSESSSSRQTAVESESGSGGQQQQQQQREDEGGVVVFQSLETAIAENGGNLSLGQRQLVALARALVRRSKVGVAVVLGWVVVAGHKGAGDHHGRGDSVGRL
jgi:ABC-type multidrug transport system fused ATPase/permease subunit